MATKYAVKIQAAKIKALATFSEAEELPDGFAEITYEKYVYFTENLSSFSKYNSVTGLLETDTEALAAINLRNVALARTQRIKDIARQRVLVDTLTELEETNEATRQAAVLTEMKAAYTADYPAIIP